MGIPMIKCALCGKEVTKRQSLLIEPYGRICRNHPEVEAHKEKLAQEVAAIKAKVAADKEMDEHLKKAGRMLNIISMTEMLRVLAYKKDLPVEIVTLALLDKIPADIRDEVIKEIRAKGSITDDEMSQSIFAYAHMQSVINTPVKN